jgi:uncharacterized protein (TIGR03437 family)
MRRCPHEEPAEEPARDAARQLAAAIAEYRNGTFTIEEEITVRLMCMHAPLNFGPDRDAFTESCNATVRIVRAPKGQLDAVMAKTQGVGAVENPEWVSKYMDYVAAVAKARSDQMFRDSNARMQQQHDDFERAQAVRAQQHQQFMATMQEGTDRSMARAADAANSRHAIAQDWCDYALDRQTVTGAGGTVKISNAYTRRGPTAPAITIRPTIPTPIPTGFSRATGRRPRRFTETARRSSGITWTELPPVASSCNYGDAFAIHPSVSGTWLIAESCYSPNGSYAAIYRSTDGGNAWTEVEGLSAALSFYQIGFNGADASFAYASGVTETPYYSQYNAVFQTSSDSGVTWASAPGSGSTSLPSGSGYAYVLFAAAPSAPKTVYLLVESYVSPTVVLQLFKTIDQGTTWTTLTAFPSDPQDPRPPGLVAVAPSNPNMVFAGAVLLYGSTDGGQTWQRAGGTALHVDNHAMIFSQDGTLAYESNDGGVWTMNTASSNSWVNLNAGFGTAEFYPGIGIDPTNIARAFGGTQDNGTLQYSGFLGWTYAGVCGDGFATAINSTSSNIVYATCNGGFFESVTGGAPGTWNAGGHSGRPCVSVFHDGSGVAECSLSVRASSNRKRFRNIPKPRWGEFLAAGRTAFQASVAAVAVAPSDSNTVVAADQAGNVSLTTNALSGSASTWVSHSPPNTPTFAIFEVTGIAIDPANPKQIYLICPNGLFESLDGAVTWQSNSLVNVTGNLTGLVIDPDIPDTLYLSTDSSVFRSSDGGASWYPLASGFPFINVSSVTLHHASRTLRSGTVGRGAWDLAVPTTAPRVSKVSVAPAVPGPGALLTVSGVNFVSNSVAWMNGSPLDSNFVSDTQLTATVPPSLSRNANGDLIAVYTPGNSGGLSNPVSVIVPSTPVFSAVVPIFSITETIQPGEWVSIYGASLAGSTVIWNGDFQTSLGGTTVTINGRAAYLSYVSPTQINLQAPDDSARGPVPVVVTTAYGTATSKVTLAQFAPSFCLLDTKHVAAIIPRSNGLGAYGGGTYDILGPTGNSLGYATVAAKAGDTVELFAVGLGPTKPVVLAGQAFSGAAPTTNPVSLLINNVIVTPQFVGLASAGLYQINFVVPADLGTGDVSLVATVAGASTPSGVVISLQLPRVQSLTLSSNSVAGGGMVTGTVTLSAAAPSGGAAVGLYYDGSTGLSAPPYQVIVPAGDASATFTLSAGTVTCSQAFFVSAIYGGSEVGTYLTVTPPAGSAAPPALAPGDVLQATFTSVPNTSDFLVFFDNDPLTLTGSPVLTTELFDGTNLLGSVVSAPITYSGITSFEANFKSPSSIFAGSPDQSTVVDLTSMQNGTIQGLLRLTVSGGSISGVCTSDFVLYDAVSTSSSSYRPEGDLQNINITLSSTPAAARPAIR